ncbi:hypothetical protein WAF17_10690 [Bernardetia sp. ABR2-2B]|uniref:hypothetical protein n=1 Tax=Bernardetia sp. ABR2-2B TaxID=3127472 RepID=UPI0030D2D153
MKATDKILQAFGGLGKKPSENHSGDPFQQALNETRAKGYYEEAAQKLTPTTQAQKRRGSFKIVKSLKGFYHIVSFLLGLITAYLVGKTFAPNFDSVEMIAMAILIGLFSVGIFYALEKMKAESAQSIAQSRAIGDKASTMSWIGLLTCTLASIVISATGGAHISATLQDKSSEITATSNQEADSIKASFSEQISSYDLLINSANETLKKHKTSWQAITARKDLKEAQEQKNKLLEMQTAALSEIKADTKSSLSANDKDSSKNALIAAVVILILEILCIYGYFYEYSYYRFALDEGVAFNVIPPVVIFPEVQYQQASLGGFQAQHQHKNPIGFGSQNRNNDPQASSQNHVCRNCGTSLSHKRSDAVFCSNNCRVIHHRNIGTGTKGQVYR